MIETNTATADSAPGGESASAAAEGLIDHLLRSIDSRRAGHEPYPHWFLSDVLPTQDCEAVVSLPFAPAAIKDTKGKRETHNALRAFYCPQNRARFPVCERIAAAFQGNTVVRALEQAFAITLGGSYLRIEHCQDTSGFWLEPHRDVSVKLLTMQIYLSRGPDAQSLGTDIYLDETRWLATAPSAFNSGFVFVPGDNTWHGFRERTFDGVRRSLIINYVTPEWQSRQELAFPDEPILS